MDGFFEVRVDPRGVVVVTRTELPFESLEQVESAYLDLIAELEVLPRARSGLLVDLRRAPPRHDPEFEALMARLRPLLVAGFARKGALVQSAIGRLQVQRHAGEDGEDMRVFTSYDEAMATLARTSMRPRA